MIRPADWLRAHGAQTDVVVWAEGHADWPALWEACPRGDWLLGIAARAGIDPRSIGVAAVAIARLEEHLVSPEVAAALAAGTGDGDAIEEASGREGDPAVAAATLAAACALRASRRPEDGAMAAALVAQAAAISAGDCAVMAAVSFAHKKAAELVRAQIPGEAIARAIGGVAVAPTGGAP